MALISRNFEVASDTYRRTYPGLPFFDTWIPREMFISVQYDGDGNVSISRQDDGVYGIALGTYPMIPAEWKNFSMDSRGVHTLPSNFKAVAEWDAYFGLTYPGERTLFPASSEAVIEAFLKEHAPDSSVFPGNSEIEHWIEIQSEGSLVAVAALCRWQSGRVVISSVATDASKRGQGFGKELMRQCLIQGHAMGEKYLSLGVRHANESAIALYAKTGFTLMHNFTYCERR
jgi:ribosomal protein S18 acetylase RimI-like enzyme